jgi:CheY-like chemotaxis protein
MSTDAISGPGRILVIDDSEVMLSRIKKMLVAAGFTVTTTQQTVGNARHLASCDLVIIDYHMPGIDGQSVLSALRGAAAQLEHAPSFYLYTSDAQIASNYAQLGFDGCFTDKGSEDLLVYQVRGFFRLRQIRSQSRLLAKQKIGKGSGNG